MLAFLERYKIIKKSSLAAIIFSVIIAFLAVNMFGRIALQRFSADFTDGNIYSLSAGSKNMLSTLEHPITLKLYYSNRLANGFPVIKRYAGRVKNLLDDYASHANGNLILQVIDPEPFSEAEDEALSYELTGANINEHSDEKLYFGLVALDSADQERAIPFLHLDRERFIEYDISKLIYELSNPKKPKIGLLSTIPLQSGSMFGVAAMGGKRWVAIEQLDEFFDVVTVDTKDTALPTDLDMLMLIQPRTLPEPLLHAIDQYALSGGHMMLFIDPLPLGAAHKEEATPAQSKPFDALLKHWGITVSNHFVVGDYTQALPLRAPNGNYMIHDITNLAVVDEAINRDDITTALLTRVHMAGTGFIEHADDSGLVMTPLLQSSLESAPVAVDQLGADKDVQQLLRQFSPDEKQYVMAARFSGQVSPLFADKNPANHTKNTRAPMQLVVVADTDLLRDEAWVHKQRFLGYELLQPIADNSSLLINSIDHLTGSEDLISLRSGASTSRPFTVVDNIKRDAEQRYLAEEERLQARLAETEQKLQQLQEKAQQGNALMTEHAQREEIKRFSAEAVTVRKALRQVQSDLRKDIESLGTWLKVINIGLMPCLVILLALFYHGFRSRRARL